MAAPKKPLPIETLQGRALIHYLMHMDQETYRKTNKINPADKKDEIINRFIDIATPEQMKRIFANLLAHEYVLGLNDPIRTGNRFLGKLIGRYVQKIDGERFNVAYEENKGLIYDFKPDQTLFDLFTLVYTMAPEGDVKDKKIPAMPTFYYQQTLSGIVNLSKNVEGRERFNKSFEKHNTALSERVKAETKQDRISMLSHIKDVIISNCEKKSWKLGGFLFFKGGVSLSIDGKTYRVPHRVAEIYKIVSDDSPESSRSEKIMAATNKAQEAIEKPRIGRDRTTTAFYESIVDFNIKASEAQEGSSLLLADQK